MHASSRPFGCPCAALGPPRPWARRILLWCFLPVVIAVQPSLGAAEELIGQRQTDFELMTSGWELTPEDVGVLEARVAKNPEDVDARMLLISYYFQHAERDGRLRHIYWMIENQPASDRFDFRGMGIGARESSLGGPESFARARDLWGEQVKKHPANGRVHANAARMLEQELPEWSVDLWQRARDLEPDNPHWAFHLGRHCGIVLQTDGRMYPQKPWTADLQAFANRTLADVRTSGDAEVIGMVGMMLTPPVGEVAERLRQRAPASWPPNPHMADLAEELIERARALQPDEPRWESARARFDVAQRETSSADTTPSSGSSGTNAFGSEGPVGARRLLRYVKPKLPPMAGTARIQGDIRLRLRIGNDGSVTSVEVLSGHPLLVPPAREAVMQWQFQPVLDDNGDPVEATLEVNVPFRLDR